MTHQPIPDLDHLRDRHRQPGSLRQSSRQKFVGQHAQVLRVVPKLHDVVMLIVTAHEMPLRTAPHPPHVLDRLDRQGVAPASRRLSRGRLALSFPIPPRPVASISDPAHPAKVQPEQPARTQITNNPAPAKHSPVPCRCSPPLPKLSAARQMQSPWPSQNHHAHLPLLPCFRRYAAQTSGTPPETASYETAWARPAAQPPGSRSSPAASLPKSASPLADLPDTHSRTPRSPPRRLPHIHDCSAPQRSARRCKPSPARRFFSRVPVADNVHTTRHTACP